MWTIERLQAWMLSLTLAAALAGACSATKSIRMSGSASNGNGVNAGAGGVLLSIGSNGAGGGDPSCFKCSADLHSIVDCDGNLLKECPPDQGCAPGGVCTTPCEAAQANKSTLGCEFTA